MATTADPKDPKIVLTWQAPKFLFYRKSPGWYAAMIGVAAGVVALAFLLEYFKLLQVSPWLVSVVAVVGVIVLIFRSNQDAPTVSYAIAEEGVIADDVTTPYEKYRAFGIVDMDNHTVLRLWPVAKVSLPTLYILEQIDPQEVRELLSAVLPEEEGQQTLSDRVAHFFKF